MLILLFCNRILSANPKIATLSLWLETVEETLSQTIVPQPLQRLHQLLEFGSGRSAFYKIPYA